MHVDDVGTLVFRCTHVASLYAVLIKTEVSHACLAGVG
jgi:hypothetical protein